MKKLFTKGTGLILTALCILCANTVFSASNYSYDISTKQYSSLQGSVTYVPVGTKTSAILSQTLDSKTLSEGTSVYATLNKDFSYNSINIAPAGSTINGTVVKCKKAGIGNRNGQIQVRFTNIRTPQGYNIPVSAMIATTDGTGVLKGGSKLDSAKDYGKNAAIGAAGGAILGTAMGPLSGGEVGRGAVYGTAVGGGLGLLNAARQSGEDVVIPANAVVGIYFDQPITISAPNGY
ncbi:TPA: hypothetical protein IAA68_03640 [Candidatus Galligastranaerophilus faecipullorum]|nr:hypothetical protein [Candidatus Galligastranaerophilus faecipullorum]